jgi:hypothetical protein
VTDKNKADEESDKYVRVPIEPTEEMCAAGAKYYSDNFRPGHAKTDTNMALIYEAMIGARPKIPMPESQ